MNYKKLVIIILLVPQVLFAQKKEENNGLQQRAYLVKTLTKIADPVLMALSKGELVKTMPIESRNSLDRTGCTYLEAFGRLMAGMAPWLELGPDNTVEGKLRKKYIDLSIACIKNATDPDNPDYMNFRKHPTTQSQALVDAAFLAQALLRSPNQLWGKLDDQTKKNVINAFNLTREMNAYGNNWVLFSSEIEAFFLKYDKVVDRSRLDRAIDLMVSWYKGDGIYGDGPNFHYDYYNSFVIHPMLLETSLELKNANLDTANLYPIFLDRARRYATIQERLISPEGTYPPVGRSLSYRFGAFQLLSKIAYMHELDKGIEPAQVRCALYTVIKRQIEMPGTFNSSGWLNIGFAGHQPEVGETYVSTGSEYLCSEAFIILGLPSNDPLWTAADASWTAKKAWNGETMIIDHTLTPDIIGADVYKERKK
ncbi:DUF2264 domain-containing protein [Sphingobacterium detergens]|uniref:DUF2264 domain-containing protein n=1 Tax=Sphingobacterium detergens TaxID=1145106 RepID=A0A420AG48_SPHD1|nr:DUF2264 domain-containing protein [Sphingobacterium detergens]RKE43371.1 hypothetical protein DFQ12_5155 [Sphingobacterium detergens]